MADEEPSGPADNEVEVSVFGRGFGECVVCHLGGGQWIIVDSLLTPEGVPVALSYLASIGVAPTQVSAVIFTHWHDDHVKGAAELVRNCTNATIAFPITLCKDEFKQLLAQYGRVSAGRFTSGVEELFQVLEILRNDKGRLRFAVANRVLNEAGQVRVDALSPSDEDVQSFLVAIEEWARETSADARLSKPQRNDTSVVVVVKVADELILLGGDLEVRGAGSGWQAVHELAWGSRGKAKIFKVPHHGSVTGEYEPVWLDMLEDKPIAVLAPYNRGHKIPTNDDVARICSSSGEAYAANKLAARKGSKQNRTVERTLEEANIRLFRMPAEVGQVRLRKTIGSGNWSAALFRNACHLKDIAA